MTHYVIGMDFGTDSCRGVVVDCNDGREISASIFYYPRWKEKRYCDPQKSQYRQHPLDYLEGIDFLFQKLTEEVGEKITRQIVGISVATTGSTPCVVDKEGKPLALRPEFSENPNGMFILWKDHTAVKEAKEITEIAKKWGGEDYTKYVGGIYSSEWYFSKLLHVLREEPQLKKVVANLVEQCDYIPAYLTGAKDVSQIKRSRCAAGHKAMWHESFGGLPKKEFFQKVDPLLEGLGEELFEETFTSDFSAGILSESFRTKYGFSQHVQVGVGAFDCHMGAVGGNIHSKSLVKVIGTSTCDIVIQDYEKMKGKVIHGICGQVDGSVMKGKIGLEAGQSAFGDFYAWYQKLLEWPLKFIPSEEKTEICDKMLTMLEKEAMGLEPKEIITLDWINGRRSPMANQELKTAIMGLDLSSTTVEIYRSIVESTVYGANKIVECFLEAGIELEEIIAIGGVAQKSSLAMQILSDVTGLPVKVSASQQAVSLGAACFAAVVGGVYPTVEKAQQRMASSFSKIYVPRKEYREKYQMLYRQYLKFGNLIEKNFC